ncbi:MAG: cytidylate kinase family protein [Candidatus Aenigmarchaeota archaeon]|nr:cytidylate kinase family protein [Candidatus Aenigmarchaeota archaeon]
MKTFIKLLENYEKDLEKRITKKGVTVTVSGLSGVGKGTVAEALAKNLNLQKVVMGDIFRKIAKERGIGLEKLSATREDELDLLVEKTALELAMTGNVVLDGRMTALSAGNNADCRILIECMMEKKSDRVAKRENISIEEAAIRLKSRDAADSAKYLRLYGLDVSERSFYDVVIETTNMDIETTKNEAVKIVRQVLKDKL